MLFRVSSKSCRSGNVAKASETEKSISNLFNNAFSNLLDNASWHTLLTQRELIVSSIDIHHIVKQSEVFWLVLRKEKRFDIQALSAKSLSLSK